MDTTITVIQVALLIFATAGGLLRFATPQPSLAKLPFQEWANDFQSWQIKTIGLLEIAAGLVIVASLFMPSLTMLAVLAAVGIALIMAGAMATHLRRSEYLNMGGNFVWLGLALFFAYSKLLAV